VYDKIALALETLAARGAIIIVLTRVRGHVLREADLTAERLVARRALERLLTCVFTHVLLQLIVRSVLLAALGADLRSPLPSHRRLLFLPLLIVVTLLRRYRYV